MLLESIKLSEMSKINCGILRNATSTRPALWILEADGVRAVVKDFSVNGFLFRNIIGRLLVWRECRAYRKLKGIEGIPTLLGTKEGLAILMSEVKGRDLENIESGSDLPEDFFRNLKALLDVVHRHGLVHCDLKRAPNTLLGDDGRPYIVDWSASLAKTELKIYPLNLIYKRFIKDDRNAIIKLMLKYRPEDISSEEKEQYMFRSRSERIIRSIRNSARKFLQKIS